MTKRVIGPDLDDLLSYEELPIGSTITGIGADSVRTGRWRYYRPQLGVGIPPCQAACPAGVDIRGFVSLIRQKRFEDAYRCYVMENPFPGLCGRLCDRPCERSCLRNEFDESVDIQDLERFISLEGSPEEFGDLPLRPQRTVAIVGNGIRELACMYFLRRLGYATVLLLEQEGMGSPTSGGILTALGLPVEDSLKAEIRSLLKSKGGREASLRVEKEVAIESLGRYDAVLWGKDSEGPKEVRGLFQVPREHGPIPRAVGQSKEIAIAIDLYLMKQNMADVREFITLGPDGSFSFARYLRLTGGERLQKAELVKFEQINTRTFDKELRLRGKRGGEQRSNDILTRQEAVRAARRCFQCGSCTLCGRCVLYCPDQAVEHDRRAKRIRFDYDFCKGCGICVYECPRGAIDFVKEETRWQ